MKPETLICGRRPVLEVLRAGRRQVKQIFMLDHGQGAILEEIRERAARRGAEVRHVDRRSLDHLAHGKPHQGVLAAVEPLIEMDLDGLLHYVHKSREAAFLVVLDEPKDPQNVGAIIRTAEGAGAHGVVMTLHRSVEMGLGMARASAGAVEYLPMVRVVNLRDALTRIKDAGCWIIGADTEGKKEYTAVDLTQPVALVLGEEGRGLRELTKRTCDELVRIPLRGKVESLNVSASAAILCYELLRQRMKI